MKPLSRECVLAVAMEIIRSYLEGDESTLKAIGESPNVVAFCRRKLPPSTIHYIKKAVDELPLWRSLVRRGAVARSFTDAMTGRALILAEMWYDAIALGCGAWWWMEVFTALGGVLSEEKAVEDILSKLGGSLRVYFELLDEVVSNQVIYRRGGGYNLRLRVRKEFIESIREGTYQPNQLMMGYAEIVEMRDSLGLFLERLNRVGKYNKHVLFTLGKDLSSLLKPFTNREQYVMAVKAAASDALLRLALHRVAETIENSITTLLEEKGWDRVVRKTKSRSWRSKMVSEGLGKFLNDAEKNGLHIDTLKSWAGIPPIEITRSKTYLGDVPSITLVIIVKYPPPV